MKIPRCKFIVIENGEIKRLRVGEKSRMRELAKEYAMEFGGTVVVDQDGDYVVDLDQGSLDMRPRVERQLEKAELEKEGA